MWPLSATLSGATDWTAAVSIHARDPYHNRRALLALRHQADGDVPPAYLLALADAKLRARRYDRARDGFLDWILRQGAIPLIRQGPFIDLGPASIEGRIWYGCFYGRGF